MALLCAIALAACGGAGGGGSSPSPDKPPPSLVYTTSGMAVVKVRSSLDGATVMEERLTPLLQVGPQRLITLLDPAGAVRARYSPPAQSSLIDFAQHASGEITAALATARTVTLVRLDPAGNVLTEFPLLDPQAPTDPFFDSGGVRDDGSMVPPFTRDAIRVVPAGQDGADVVVALRTGRYAVVAYRYAYTRAGGFARAWRTLVEPGVSMFGIGITTGSFDTFGQLENHFHVHVDADAAGNVAVGVLGNLATTFVAHAAYFQEPTAVQRGFIVTRLAPDGQRLGATVVDTVKNSEMHGLRLHFDGVAVVGRIFSEARTDGSGWNAWAADVDRASGALRFYRVIDVDRGDALFDIAALADGRFLACGSTGYTENPAGASISEEAAPLLVVLEADGSLHQRIDVAGGARNNQIRSIAARGTDWLLGALVNGPGTHSGDANPALITADGFARQVPSP
jgi:hypothetical protein